MTSHSFAGRDFLFFEVRGLQGGLGWGLCFTALSAWHLVHACLHFSSTDFFSFSIPNESFDLLPCSVVQKPVEGRACPNSVLAMAHVLITAASRQDHVQHMDDCQQRHSCIDSAWSTT